MTFNPSHGVHTMTDLHYKMSRISTIAPLLTVRQLLDIADALEPLDPDIQSMNLQQLLDLLGIDTH